MKKIILLLLTFSIINCAKNSDETDSTNQAETTATDIDLVTGINLRAFPGQAPIKLGNPNIFLNNQISIFPNPIANILSISSSNNITDIWVVPANAEKIFQEIDFAEILNSNLYSETQIDSNSIMKLTDQNSPNLNLDFENLNSGYFKIFVKVNGIILWDNLYLSDGNTEIEDLIDFWN